MLLDQHPYYICNPSGVVGEFEKHRHPEIEFNYCYKGEYSIIIDNEEIVLKQGELLIVSSMEAHEYPGKKSEDCRALVFEVGPIFLTEYFDLLANIASQNPIIKVDEENNKELYDIFCEIIALQETDMEFSGLALKGDLYKICSYLLRELKIINPSPQLKAKKHLVANIEKALELIQYRYSSALSVEEVAEICGYSKGNFCKTFKNITGDTFHHFLNKYRIKMACMLLDLTDYSVDTIASEVGFADAKAFCRVFKSIKGMTTGEYRKEKRKK